MESKFVSPVIQEKVLKDLRIILLIIALGMVMSHFFYCGFFTSKCFYFRLGYMSFFENTSIVLNQIINYS